MTPADEIRTAADKLRAAAPAEPALIRLREPLATWLEHEAELAASDHLYAEREPCGWCGEPASAHALATARAILGTAP